MSNSYPAQTDQQRFQFCARQVSSPGTPAAYDVIDGGGSLNSAGFVGSCSGQAVGRIVWDAIEARWSFVLDKKGVLIAGADATQITTFLATLAAQTLAEQIQK